MEELCLIPSFSSNDQGPFILMTVRGWGSIWRCFGSWGDQGIWILWFLSYCCQKEGCQRSPVYWLLHIKWRGYKGCLSTPKHWGDFFSTFWTQIVFSNGLSLDQIEMEEDKPKTAFICPLGFYEFNWMWHAALSRG